MKLINKLKNKKHIKLIVGIILAILISSGITGIIFAFKDTNEKKIEKITLPALMQKLGFEDHDNSGIDYENTPLTITFHFSKTGKLQHLDKETEDTIHKPKNKVWKRYLYRGTDYLGDLQKLADNNYKISESNNNLKIWEWNEEKI